MIFVINSHAKNGSLSNNAYSPFTLSGNNTFFKCLFLWENMLNIVPLSIEIFQRYTIVTRERLSIH